MRGSVIRVGPVGSIRSDELLKRLRRSTTMEVVLTAHLSVVGVPGPVLPYRNNNGTVVFNSSYAGASIAHGGARPPVQVVPSTTTVGNLS